MSHNNNKNADKPRQPDSSQWLFRETEERTVGRAAVNKKRGGWRQKKDSPGQRCLNKTTGWTKLKDKHGVKTMKKSYWDKPGLPARSTSLHCPVNTATQAVSDQLGRHKGQGTGIRLGAPFGCWLHVGHSPPLIFPIFRICPSSKA